MVQLSNGQYIIGFDNGYQFGKTAEALFDNGGVAQLPNSIVEIRKSG